MKHVLIVNHNAGSVYHGPNFRSYYVARSLVESGFQVTIACSSFSHKLTKLPIVTGDFREQDVDGIRVIWLKTPPYRSNLERLWNYYCFFRRLALLDELISDPVDAVICSSPPPYWIWSCRKISRNLDAKLIFEARDLWPDVIIETRRTAFLNPAIWLMMAAERYAYRSSDFVVGVNSEVLPTMQKRGLDPQKFWTIPNGVVFDSTTEERELSSEVRELLPGGDCFLVGYAGALSEVYGLRYLIDAAEMLQNTGIVFVLAGNGADELKLRERSAHLPNVIFVGWIPKQELFSFIQYMDITYAGLLDRPSFAAGSDSTKVFEYMKAHRPVVHAIGSGNGVVEKSGCGLRVRPESAVAISDAVQSLRGLSEAERWEMGEKGLEYLKKNRTYDILGRKWMELLGS